MSKLTCSCGGGDGAHHPLGEGKCLRQEASGEMIPTNPRLIEDTLHYDVNGYPVTAWVLRNQRLYTQHEPGRWSHPKSKSSTISIGDNW